MNSVGLKLKEIRTKKKFTQSKLAEGIVNRSYVSQIEKGTVQPSYKILKKLSERLDCDINDFFNEKEKNSLLKLDIKKELSTLEYLVVNGECSFAFEKLKEIEDDLKELTHTERGILYFCEGKIQEKYKKNFNSAIHLYKKSYALLSSSKLYNENLRTLNHLVNLFLESNKVSEAFEYLDKAYNLLVSHKVSGLEKVFLLTNLGTAHAKLGEYYSAIRFLCKSIDTSNKTSIYFHTGKAYMVLGLCYRRIHDYKNAEDSYEQALHFFKGTKDYLNLAGTLTNLGILYRYKNKLDSSISYLEEANSIYKGLDDQKGYLNTLYELSITQSTLNHELTEISKYYSLFLDNLQETETNTNLYIKFTILVGDINMINNNVDDAIKLYEKLLSKEGNQQFKKELMIKLSKAFSCLGDSSSIMDLWKRYSLD